ncbi:MAG: hypothetical protein WDZ94_02475 [Patescibacteria group bacterium]
MPNRNPTKPREEDKLQELARENQEILVRATGVFPFDFFPSTVLVTKSKVDIQQSFLTYTSSSTSFLISDIARIEVTSGFLFSTLLVRAKMSDKILAKASYLPKGQANEVQSVIQGLMIAENENVNVSRVDAQSVRDATEDIGESRDDSLQ